jgi:hypothetical protein
VDTDGSGRVYPGIFLSTGHIARDGDNINDSIIYIGPLASLISTPKSFAIIIFGL